MGAVGVQFALRWLVGFVDGRSDATRALVVVALAVLHVPGLIFHDPDLSLQWAPFVGSIGLVCLFVSGLALLPVAARTASVWLVRSGRMSSMLVPSMLRVLGFRSPPLFGLVLLWLLLAWSVPYEGYHEVRSLTGPFAGDSDIKLAGPRTPAEVAADWVARQNGTGRQPALLVAASGGGIRAAYWTSLVLTCAIERDGPETDPCRDPSPYAQARRESLLAMSGISGGSLGLASYVTAVGGQWSSAADGADATPLTMSWIDRRLGADFLSPTLATWLFNDGVNALLRPAQGVDRAAVLERAWEQEWPDTELEAPFFRGQATGDQPLLLLNGYNAEDGCRVNVSILSSTPGSFVTPDACGEALGPNRLLWSTADAWTMLCPGSDMRMSTAALSSARFPFVTPAGRIVECTVYEDRRQPPDVEVVDGGYRETSGASTLVEAWPDLEQAVTTALGDDQCVDAIFLQIDNGYESAAVTPSGGGVISQYFAPATAIVNAPGGIEGEARQQAGDMFVGVRLIRITTQAHPGASAPLGWLLSGEAQADLDAQLTLNGPWIVLLRALLDDTTLTCDQAAASAS